MDATIRGIIVTHGAVEPLLALARSDEVEVQMETLSCLCNLSLSGFIGQNPLAFLSAMDVTTLVAFLCSADSTYRSELLGGMP